VLGQYVKRSIGITTSIPIPFSYSYRLLSEALNSPKLERYFFHVKDDHKLFRDEAGTVLPNEEVVNRQAAVIAEELAQDGRTCIGFAVYVVGKQGNEIAWMPIVGR
jgi:hypothetical protein